MDDQGAQEGNGIIVLEEVVSHRVSSSLGTTYKEVVYLYISTVVLRISLYPLFSTFAQYLENRSKAVGNKDSIARVNATIRLSKRCSIRE